MPAVLTGLTTAEATKRLAIDGPNQLPQARPPSALRLLGRQFTHLLAVLLWVASAMALVAGQPPLAVAIVVVILLNALFAFAQEYRADRSAEELRSMLPVSARVRRDGQLRVVDASKLVRDDLVVLRPGDRISADLELTVSHSLEVDESMVTGDHPGTAAAVAREVGLLGENGVVLDAGQLPTDDDELAALLDGEDGTVVARVMPDQKLRIARVLRRRGHVVAMTGDGVNDAAAIREADVGVAMGLSGSDVTRAAADVVLLDDHFATIVNAVELGRATFANVRRFLTYHLTDNVAELAPFAAWALTGGQLPLAIGVLQVLALGHRYRHAAGAGARCRTPEPGCHAAPGSEARADRRTSAAPGPAGPRGHRGRLGTRHVRRRPELSRAGDGVPRRARPRCSVASGATFAAIALGQMANAFACRSETVPVWRLAIRGNRFVVGAVVAELLLLAAFLGFPPLARLLGGSAPPAIGWALRVGRRPPDDRGGRSAQAHASARRRRRWAR